MPKLSPHARPTPAPFGGVGFHCFDHLHSQPGEHYDQVIAKRWALMRPSFARLTDRWNMQPDKQAWLATNIRRMQETGTSVYLTTWDPPDLPEGDERAGYARKIADNLEFLVRDQGCTNLRWYCMSNELSMNGWGVMRDDLPKFRDYHVHIHRELARRKLDVALLATDASPTIFWPTIEWAAEHMDDVTGAYGGHDYFNDHDPADLSFYDWFTGKVEWAAALARGRGKPFIIGEFGSAQHKGARYGIKNWDGCRWFDTPTEPLAAVQVAEAVVAAVNAGIFALGYWTFTDFPDPKDDRYANKWGTFRWSGTDYSPRPLYYALGPITRAFRGPAQALAVRSDDPLVRAAAIRGEDGTVSVLIVNRHDRPTDVAVDVGDAAAGSATFRTFAFDPAAVPTHLGDALPPPTDEAPPTAGVVRTRVGPQSTAVITTTA